jgi:hypothetical protein
MAENNEGKKPRRAYGELRIYGVHKTAEELKNIADHVGINTSDFLKPHLKEIVSKYPEHYRKPMLD